MKTVLKILGACGCLFLAGAQVLAQEGEEQDLEMLMFFSSEELDRDEVESVSFHRQSVFWSPSAVTVFTREDIRSSGAGGIADLLRRVPGFDVYLVKASYPLVGSRALTDDSNNLVLVLVDGRETMVELSGFTFWEALTVDLEEIERIEVIRSPGSTLYGANALAAVVNITTVSEQPADGVNLYVTGGQEGQHRLFGRIRESLRVGSGALDLGLALGHKVKHSPSDPRDESVIIPLRSHGYLRYREEGGLDLSLQAGGLLADGLFVAYTGDVRTQNSYTYWIMGKGETGLGESTSLKLQTYYSQWRGNFHNRVAMHAMGVWVAEMPPFIVDVKVFDSKLQLDTRPADDLWLVGGTYFRYVILGNKRMVLTDTDELMGGAFAQAQWSPWKQKGRDIMQLTAGLRVDFNPDTETALSPRAAVVFRPSKLHAFRLSYALAFRKPSTLESRIHGEIQTYNPGIPEVVEFTASQLGNEDLVNEKVHSFEVGWRTSLLEDRIQVTVDGYYNLYRDAIVFVRKLAMRQGLPDLGESVFRFENMDERLSALGGEAEICWQAGESLRLWGNLGFRRVVDFDTGEKIRSEPSLRINLGGRYLSEDGLLTDLALHFVSGYEMPLINPAELMLDPEWTKLGENFLAFLRLGYRTSFTGNHQLEAGLMLRIPFDQSFREYPGVPWKRTGPSITSSDFGGEYLNRIVLLYLRGSF